MLEAVIFFQGLARVNSQFFKRTLQTYLELCIFCTGIQYMLSKGHPVERADEVLADSSEDVFDEAHFVVNWHSFLQPRTFPRHTFPSSGSFVTHSPRQNNFQYSSALDASKTAPMCIFFSILNHCQVNQKNSIIKAGN